MGLERDDCRRHFTPNFLIAIAASPPEEVALPAISTAVAMHTGHMGFSSRDELRWVYAGRGSGWSTERSSALGPQLDGTGTSSRRR
jgi:hypothetical protein